MNKPALVAAFLSAVVAFAPAVLHVQSAAAQQRVIQTPPNRGGFTTSMGLPPAWRWALGASGGVHRRDGSEVTMYFTGGFYKDLVNPLTSALGIIGEGYVGRRGGFESSREGFDGGFRAGLFSPTVRFAGGLDYNFKDGEGDFFLSLIHPLKRGGIFTNGGSLRFDYIPGRNHSTSVGVRLPIGQRWVGTSRPRNDYMRLSDPEPPVITFDPPADLLEAVSNAEGLGHWINRLTVPFTDQWDGDKDKALQLFVGEMTVIKAHLNSEGGPLYSGRRTPIRDVAAFHAELERAFSIAATGQPLVRGQSNALGIQVANKAREAVLDDVIFPYNRLLGQKRRKDSTRGLGTAASAAFYQWLANETPVAQDRLRATAWTFARYLDVIEETRRYNREQWLDARFVWLPYQLALKAEQHDEQWELNALVERATEVEFVKASPIWYVENEQFQTELSRMILEAEDYHVLWLHDFRGYDAEGDPDEMAFKQVTQAYLPALINAVNNYDLTGKIPQYIQILDQLFFLANRGHLWANFLQDPLHHQIDLPQGFGMWEDSIASLQGQLREAVANSQLLQAQAGHFEDGWIENLVKVHVNITQPPDPSYWSRELFPFFMGLPDTHMRDHRKIAIYDVSERDPYKGGAIYTGMGVGEHYVGAGWEDRAIMAEGPVLLHLRNSVRQVLLNQGFAEHEIPWELQPKPYSDDYGQKTQDFLASRGDWGWTMEIHNQVGFRPKAVTLFKATLYTLMPPGAVIKAPDSIWGSQLWASMMLGHALRGGRSLVIAPAIANAPSPGSPQMSRAQELLTRLVVADQMLGDEIEAQGGLIKVGLYSTALDVGDIPGKIGALLDNLERTPWLKELYDFDPAVIEGLAEERRELIAQGFARVYAVDQEVVTAKLHMKAHLYFAREAWDRFLSSPAIEEVVRAHFEELAAINRALSSGETRDYHLYSDRLGPIAIRMVQQFIDELSEEEESRLSMFLEVGSHNQNNRSLALDGEVAFVTAGWKSLAGLMDFITIAGLCDWIDSLEELEELFPGYDGMARRISRFIRIAV
ncbi:MAG: hypothetical protein ACC667_02625 [Longimicrobiales bacterium]